jgi:hypothetical protein
MNDEVYSLISEQMSDSVKSLIKNGGALNRFWDNDGNLEKLMSGSSEEIAEVWEEFATTTGGNTTAVWSEIVATLRSTKEEY